MRDEIAVGFASSTSWFSKRSKVKSNLPDPQEFIGLAVEEDGDFKIVEHIGSGCNAHVFRGYSENLDLSVAFKVIPSSNLAAGDAWKTEPRKANKLEHPSVVHCQSQFDWQEKMGCVVLKYDFVDGTSLTSYLKKNRKGISIPFVVEFTKTMLNLFYEMDSRKIAHGDFHAGNILVTKPSAFQRNATEQFKVTDFGVGTSTSGANLLDDFDQLAEIVKQLLSCQDYTSLLPKDKFTYDFIHDHLVARHLVEKDRTLDPLARNPDGLLNLLDKIESDYAEKQLAGERFTLLTPFDYLSCEQIGDRHSLLHSLYSDKFLGIQEIEAANNLVVTGPRGCGKSTVFRSLSLQHQVAAGVVKEEHWQNKSYIGIYYHCHDLYFKFPRYIVPERTDAIDLPLHYLTARLLIEIVEALRVLQKVIPETAPQEGKLCKGLWELLKLNRPSLPGADSYEVISTALSKECQWAVEKQRFASTGTQPIGELYGPDMLLSACALVHKELPLLESKPFYCFIDEYSIPRVSESLQQNLNRLLMSRTEFCFFKMATESPVSFVASDVDGKQYVEGREFEILNLGLTYLRGEDRRKLDFLDDVFARRLSAVSDYPVSSLLELIGDGAKESHNDVAERLANSEKVEWWGRPTLADMCSGDIHQLITIVRKMVADAGGHQTLSSIKTTPKISTTLQHKAIRQHAGDFLQSLASTGEYGERVRRVITAFANVANSYIKFRRSKNENGAPRHQASRIELYEMPVLEGEAKEIYELLLRYSVFLTDPRGKSRRGQPIPRLYLRRFLIPHYNLTFSLRDSILFEAEEFKTLLLNPVEYENKNRLKKETHMADTKAEDRQGKLDLQ